MSLFRGFTAMRLDSWPTIPARKMPYGVNGILVGGEKPPTHLKNHGVSNSWDVPFPTEWKKNSSKPPGCMMISGYLWHFGEHWANRSIPKNSRIFPWIRMIPWEFMGINGIPYQRIKFIPRNIATNRHLWSSSCPVDSRSFIDLNADSSPRKTFHSTTS